jgi:hypothetical protein
MNPEEKYIKTQILLLKNLFLQDLVLDNPLINEPSDIVNERLNETCFTQGKRTTSTLLFIIKITRDVADLTNTKPAIIATVRFFPYRL